MIYPLISARLHGLLDDLVVLVYLMGGYIIGLRHNALAIALLGAFVHFFITRFTDYGPGIVKLLRFRTHGYIELAEGIGVLVATWTVLGPDVPGKHRAFLTLLGLAQLVAFAFSDYRWPPPGEKPSIVNPPTGPDKSES